MDRREPPSRLAADVVARMTTDEKLGEVVLVQTGGYENVNAGVPRLCIPPLTLQDGPQGVAFGVQGVTQLPSPIAVAATFDPSIARSYGGVVGAEAAGDGFDVIQGPNLNIDRVPENGRSYETFGEDPALVSTMGVAEIEGIQSKGTLAMAKHFVAYSQETDRGELDEVVGQRALEEIYLPPFAAAVRKAHVASVMCAYPQLNGVYQCQDGSLDSVLTGWGFAGFVRSDLSAVHVPAAALGAGVDLVKPASVSRLVTLLRARLLSETVLNRAVGRVLTVMFAHGLVGRTIDNAPGHPVATPAHAGVALTTAERGAVLLKNRDGILPLAGSDRSVAVIGADAGSQPVTTGYGSSRVRTPHVAVPLASLRRRAGRGVSFTYASGGSTTAPLRAVPTGYLTPDGAGGHGLTLTLAQAGGGEHHASKSAVVPTVNAELAPHLPESPLLPGAGLSENVDGLPDQSGDRRLSIVPPSPGRRFTGTDIVLPAGWSNVSATWTGTFTPPTSGLYTLSLQGSGAASLTLDGTPAVSDTLNHARGRWSETALLTGGHPYRFDLAWQPIHNLTPTGESRTNRSTLSLGVEYVSGRIAAAVEAARRSRVAVVFANDFSSEAFDKPSLSLPGDQNTLIEAVAAVNPRTVVVLNTGGPVLMPWIDRVAGVVEDWYPGEADGNGIAALLYGAVDPSGHLPVTFPGSQTGEAINAPSQWPGIGLTATYSEGLEVGYRYNNATGTAPLFPFGFGLSYTTFHLGNLAVTRASGGYDVHVDVSNIGGRSGTAVPQAYLTFPAAADEPPAQLVAFAPVALDPGQTRRVTMFVPDTALRAFLGGSWVTVPGTYTVSVGQSSADLSLSQTLPQP